ncbi:MAG TPA: adenylate/guanylate cyclase domain-containing protein [Candidatus Limnocylindria bacterium]|nr:adenylate/guanylate cyclase domain-containing protein [Candidatus Limnocylindria bacterium]
MTSTTPVIPPVDPEVQRRWEKYLESPDTFRRVGRRVFSRIPAGPRCQLCASPFHGPGRHVMRLIGKKQSTINPNMCNTCEKYMLKYRPGAEINGSMLFADIRGSTTLAETMTPTEFKATLARFYTVAADVTYANGGIVDKFVGDELVAAFPPFLGEDTSSRAVKTAEELLRATGHADPAGPWVPVGAGVTTGRVWFGAIGDGRRVEVTFLGDGVNVAARLAGAAGPGEILLTVTSAEAAGLDPSLERRSLELKGKQEATEVVSLRIGPT